MGSKSTPCSLDDELAEKLNKKNFSELREFVGKTAAARVLQAERLELNNKVSSILIDEHKFDVPSWLTVSEAKYLAHQSKLDWNDVLDVDKEKFLEMAEKNVRLSLILDRIREVEPDAQLSDNEVLEMLRKHMQSSSQPITNEILEEMNKSGYLQILFSKIRDEYTLDFIVNNSKVIE
jgi:FKBP-type peptidyl-prolyl cis-trans isomerase (trigger factor)